jgi:beta-xylosidase
MKRLFFVLSLVWMAAAGYGQQHFVSKVWKADNGNGTYTNPIINADYSDPDVCRVGNDYYMTASSFNCIPGLQILHSNDLVNWSIIGYAVPRLEPDSIFSKMQHGNGIWAPSIRYHNSIFYIYVGDPDRGIFMTRTAHPEGPWEPLCLVKAGKGLIDSCPLFDDDGNIYLVHGFAGSRAGIKSMLAVTRLSADGRTAVGEDRIVYDGHDDDPTIEGPKFYKHNGYYYIFAPAGGVKTGWQVVLRSKNVFGPYERRVVMAQGKSNINGPHQGAWVDTPTGQDWFVHFQDCYAYGRVVLLEPMKWGKDGFPVIGRDREGKGCGEPVTTWGKPDVGRAYEVCTPRDDDEFEGDSLGLQWQWHANPQGWWAFVQQGHLSLYSVPVPQGYRNLWDVPNMLLQKLPARDFTVTAKLTFKPTGALKGERCGLVMFGMDYAGLMLESVNDGIRLSQNVCLKADKGSAETVNGEVMLGEPTVFLRITVKSDFDSTAVARCSFAYSTDGKHFSPLGKSFTAREGKWIGAKTGFFCSRPKSNNDGGRVEVDWIRFRK